MARWAVQGASLLTCEDLSMAGWRYYLGTPAGSTAVLGGRTIAMKDIFGVLTRLPGVAETELGHIVPADRAYVASEMTAFLLAWLSGLKCPVLNRPTPLCLAGPGWRPEQWTYAAARLGFLVQPVRRRLALSAEVSTEHPELHLQTVTVVGDRCFGAVDSGLESHARRLADTAGVNLLAVRFSARENGFFFLGADLWPEVISDEVADTILEYLQRGPRKRLSIGLGTA